MGVAIGLAEKIMCLQRPRNTKEQITWPSGEGRSRHSQVAGVAAGSAGQSRSGWRRGRIRRLCGLCGVFIFHPDWDGDPLEALSSRGT